MYRTALQSSSFKLRFILFVFIEATNTHTHTQSRTLYACKTLETDTEGKNCFQEISSGFTTKQSLLNRSYYVTNDYTQKPKEYIDLLASFLVGSLLFCYHIILCFLPVLSPPSLFRRYALKVREASRS